MINHIKYRGDENGSTVVKRTDRQLKVKLYTQRAAAHVELGRYHSAADDYVRVLANATSTYYVQGSTLRGGRREVRRSFSTHAARVPHVTFCIRCS